jgi:hypothetical protein
MAQMTGGILLGPSLNLMSAAGLKKQVLNSSENLGVNVNYSSRMRPGFSLGGYLEYMVKPDLFLMGELALNIRSTRILLNSYTSSLNPSGNGGTVRVTSEANFSTFSVSLPLYTKYILQKEKNIYGIAGFLLSFSAAPRLRSDEERVDVTYLNNIIRSTETKEIDTKVKINKYQLFAPSLMLGVGKPFRIESRKINIELRYALPLYGGRLHTTNDSFQGEAMNNSVFSNTLPYSTIRNFKTHSLFLIFSYPLFNFEAPKVEEEAF